MQCALSISSETNRLVNADGLYILFHLSLFFHSRCRLDVSPSLSSHCPLPVILGTNHDASPLASSDMPANLDKYLTPIGVNATEIATIYCSITSARHQTDDIRAGVIEAYDDTVRPLIIASLATCTSIHALHYSIPIPNLFRPNYADLYLSPSPKSFRLQPSSRSSPPSAPQTSTSAKPRTQWTASCTPCAAWMPPVSTTTIVSGRRAGAKAKRAALRRRESRNLSLGGVNR